MINNVKDIILNQNGQGLMEYSLILAFIAIVVLVTLEVLGIKIFGFFNSLLYNGSL